MQAKEIYCLNCDKLVPAEHINIKELIAKCISCDHVFSFRDLFDSQPRSPVKGSQPSRPSGIQVEMLGGNDVRILRSWFNPGLFFLLFFCIAWDVFLIFWYWLAIFSQDQIVWMAVCFPVLHVAVGVALTYYVLAGFLNKTIVDITKSDISIRHRPVPWLGNKTIMRQDILEIELEYNGVSDDAKGRQMTVSAHHTDGRQVVLLNGLEARKAEYMAWQIAHHLKLDLVHKNA